MGNNHSSHSHLVRFWRAKETENPFGLGWQEGETFSLKSPHDGYLVQVSFTVYPGHPEHIRIRSTNWRAEHEPNTIVSAADARYFYKTLVEAGFVKVEEE